MSEIRIVVPVSIENKEVRLRRLTISLNLTEGWQLTVWKLLVILDILVMYQFSNYLRWIPDIGHG